MVDFGVDVVGLRVIDELKAGLDLVELGLHVTGRLSRFFVVKVFDCLAKLGAIDFGFVTSDKEPRRPVSAELFLWGGFSTQNSTKIKRHVT